MNHVKQRVLPGNYQDQIDRPQRERPRDVYVAWDSGRDLHLAIRPVAPSNWGMMSFAAH